MKCSSSRYDGWDEMRCYDVWVEMWWLSCDVMMNELRCYEWDELRCYDGWVEMWWWMRCDVMMDGRDDDELMNLCCIDLDVLLIHNIENDAEIAQSWS